LWRDASYGIFLKLDDARRVGRAVPAGGHRPPYRFEAIIEALVYNSDQWQFLLATAFVTSGQGSGPAS
jgi:hypothetical protein